MRPDLLPFDQITLNPGELIVTDKEAVIKTILGSCLTVTFFSPRVKLAAMCHGMLPLAKVDERFGLSGFHGFKYVDYSIEYMVNRFLRTGVRPQEVEVKVFGGSDMFDMTSKTKATIGEQNIAAALTLLEQEGFTISKRDIGGRRGRKLFFVAHTGEVFLKRLGTSKPGDEEMRIFYELSSLQQVLSDKLTGR